MNKSIPLLFSAICIIASLYSCDKTQEKEIPVESISLSQPVAELLVGESIHLMAIVLPKQATDQTVIWASSKPSVAIVSESGIVTAIAEGQSTIIANAGGRSASCLVTVTSSSSSTASVTSVTLDKTSLTLLVGEEATLKATVKPSDAPNKDVTWVSDKTSVATVDGNGKVSAKAVGEANITVLTKVGGKKAVCNVIVTAKNVKVTGISLNKTSLSLEIGETQALVANITPSNATNKKVNWLSNDSSVASVDENGNVTGKGLGSATIIATTADGGKKATCSVKVTASTSSVAVTGVNLDKTSLSLAVGESATLTATVKPDNASNKQVSWSSSATGIASVDSNGTVTAKAEGSAKITVTTKDGNKKASCTVTVNTSSQSSSISWQLNPDCIVGSNDKLNTTRPSDNTYYGNEPYRTYGAIGLFDPEKNNKTYFAYHFKNRAECWNSMNMSYAYSFKVLNYKNEIVDIVDGYTDRSAGCDADGHASIMVLGDNLRGISEGWFPCPYVLIRKPASLVKGKDILIEVTELLSQNNPIHKGYYYLVPDAGRNVQIEFTGQGVELGTFPDSNDYLMIHEFMPNMYKNGKKILEWNKSSKEWAITSDGYNIGMTNAYRVSIRIRKLIFDVTTKDTEESFFNGLYVFWVGDRLSPYPSTEVEDGGVDWRWRDGAAIMSNKTAKYELEVSYDGQSITTVTGTIKILGYGKKVHPYHHPDGTWWN